MLADLRGAEGDTQAGVLGVALALRFVLALRLRQDQGEHSVGIQDPHLSDLGAFVAGVEVLRVASDLMVDQIGLLLLPGRLNADAVVGGADAAADRALVLYRGAVRQEGVSTAVGIRHSVPQQAGKVNLPAAGVGHRIASVQGVCRFVEGGECLQILLLGGGESGGHRWGCPLLVL